MAIKVQDGAPIANASAMHTISGGDSTDIGDNLGFCADVDGTLGFFARTDDVTGTASTMPVTAGILYPIDIRRTSSGDTVTVTKLTIFRVQSKSS